MKWSKRMAAMRLGMTPNAYNALEKPEAKISRRTELACIALFVGEEKISRPWAH